MATSDSCATLPILKSLVGFSDPRNNMFRLHNDNVAESGLFSRVNLLLMSTNVAGDPFRSNVSFEPACSIKVKLCYYFIKYLPRRLLFPHIKVGTN